MHVQYGYNLNMLKYVVSEFSERVDYFDKNN